LPSDELKVFNKDNSMPAEVLEVDKAVMEYIEITVE